MRTPLRAAFRLAITGCLGLAAIAASASVGRAAEPEKMLPDSTLFFLKVKNVAELRESFEKADFGRLLADPALKPLKDDVAAKLAETNEQVKAKLGVTLGELLQLPQGTATVAVVGKPDAKIPVALLISADAGKNAAKMTEVMTKSTKQAEEANAKVGTETFKGLTLHIIQPPQDGDKPNPPLIWTNAESVFHIATDLDALKDVITHADGRTDSLASVDAFGKAMTKLGADSPVIWFLDINKSIKLVAQAGQAAQGGGGAAQNIEGMLQLTGINGLKAVGGNFAFNSGAFDSVSKVYFLAPAPTQGLLKMFLMPPTSLRPQPWVPANVASYQSLSWDLDKAYDALNDLVNQFQPGMLQLLQQNLVGPNGGEPLDLEKDVFGPIGDRLTIISDFKKPITENSQRLLFSAALEDTKKFEATLSKVIEIAGGTPAKRDFQGTTIYDFKLPDMPAPGAGAANNNPFKNGTVSVAVAKDSVFVASEPTLLESVLRGGGSALADSPDFQAVAKQIPAQSSTLTYAKADEQARVTYDMIKSGQFEEAFQANPNGPDPSKVFDRSKLPDFSVFAKYLSAGGGFGLMEDDGMTFTTFTLRKANP
ncbi:hypothetical protein P12x_002276 [Tundrisphaera lichenicola]|uniref:hypothetical protein n=1 Tax=Tundrisphaera lichenicola TaxID=2029860 RepID=UPI003EBCA751